MAVAGGAHLVHVIVLGGWAGAVVLSVALDHWWSTSRRRGASGPASPSVSPPSRRMAPINAAAFIATWPPHPGPLAGPLPRRAPVVATPSLLQIGAVASLLAASVHLAVAPDHFSQAVLYGAFFVVVAAAQMGLAAGLLVAPSPRLIRVLGVASAAVVLLWAYTRLVGVPVGPERGGTESLGVLNVLATAAEAVCFLVAASLWSRELRPAWRARLWAPSMRWATTLALAGAGYLISVSPKS